MRSLSTCTPASKVTFSSSAYVLYVPRSSIHQKISSNRKYSTCTRVQSSNSFCVSTCVTTPRLFAGLKTLRTNEQLLKTFRSSKTRIIHRPHGSYIPVLLSLLQSYRIYFDFLQNVDKDNFLPIFVNSCIPPNVTAWRPTVLLNLQNLHNYTSKLLYRAMLSINFPVFFIFVSQKSLLHVYFYIFLCLTQLNPWYKQNRPLLASARMGCGLNVEWMRTKPCSNYKCLVQISVARWNFYRNYI